MSSTASLSRTAPTDTVRASTRPVAAWVDTLPLVIAVFLGVLIRALYTLGTNFPLNDGGLFYQMIMDLKEAGYRLPSVTTYNAANIPFAYPPLPFYVTGWLSDITPISVMDWLRYLPFLVASLTLAAFYAFARSFLTSRLAVGAAVLAFALMPRSFTWMVMGGGLTRSFGFLFVILALNSTYRFYTEKRAAHALSATLFGALTVLSHLGTVPFLAFSTLLMLAFFGRDRRAVLGTLGIGLGVLTLTAPWWATVVRTHGWGPFLAASSTGGSVFSDPEKFRGLLSILAHLGIGSWGWSSTGESLFPILAVLALFGTISAIVHGAWFLPVWWLAILTLDTRQGITFAAIPVAVLAAIGIERVLMPMLGRSMTPGGWSGRWQLGGRGFAILVFLIGYSMAASLLSEYSQASDIRFLHSLTAEERQAMRWIASHTPPSSRFLVLPDSQWDGWEVDKNSEWFPVLAERVSIATVQGSEWLPDREFTRRHKQAKVLRSCTAATVSCIDDWARANGATFSHIYIPQPPLPAADAYRLCCKLLIASLRADPRYTVLYEEPGALVFELHNGPLDQ